MEDFLDDIGTEVEINQTINTNFCQCIYVITRRFRSRDYHVTFPRVFPIGLWGFRYSLFIIYIGLATFLWLGGVDWRVVGVV